MSNKNSSLLQEAVKPLDGELWEQYSALPGLDVGVSQSLLPEQGVVDQEKAQFYAEDMSGCPDLRPRQAEPELESSVVALESFRASLKQGQPRDEVGRLYLWRINERLANLRLLQAASDGDQARFRRYNEFIYGTPSQEIFSAAVDYFCAFAEEKQKSKRHTVTEAADTVLAAFDGLRGDRQLLIPDPEVFTAVRMRHWAATGFYALLLAGVEIPGTSYIEQAEGDPIIAQIIENLESDYAIEDARGKAWSLDHLSKTVKRPADYKLPRDRFIGLPCGHEIGTHLLEYVNGLRGKLRLLSSGLDRNEIGGEGRAVMREQIVYQNFEEFTELVRWQDILRRHVATSLAYGLSGDQKIFPDVYAAINGIDKLWQRAKKPDDSEEADKTAHNRTWRLLESVYKGTDGMNTPYGRYAIYLEGNVATWQAEAARPGIMEAGDKGKFDIANNRHMEYLHRLGIVEQTLKQVPAHE